MKTPGRIHRLKDGGWYAIFEGYGRRKAHRAKSESDARTWLKRKCAEIAADAEPLTLAELMEVRQAQKMLPAGVSILDAVRAYVPPQPAPLIRDVVAAFEADKAAANLRPRSLYQLRYCCKRLTGAFGGRRIDVVMAPDLAGVLTTLAPSAIARNNLRRAWSGLWRWAIRAGMASKNPLEAITRATEEQKPPGIVTPDQAAAILAVAMQRKHDLVPFFAFGLFAGLRVAEICRLQWSAVDLRRRLVRVGAAEAKTRGGRLVTIHAPLLAWLSGRVGVGPVVPVSESTLERELAAIRKRIGYGWPRNALRHSYASYRLAVTGDAGRVATELGHGDTDMLYRHYRELVTPADGRRFFALTPATVLRRIRATSGHLLSPNEHRASDGASAGRPALEARKSA